MTISTRLTRSWGSTLISGTPIALVGTIRRPSRRIKVRCGARLRRLKKFPPLAPVAAKPAVWGRPEPLNAGSWFSESARFVGAARVSCSASATVTGVGAAEPSRATREPVTTISPPSSSI